MHSTPATQWATRLTLTVALFAMQMHGMSSAFAGLSQLPLLSSSSSAVLPNFVFTLDNSGSMFYNHLPEASVVVNGVTVQMAGSRLVRVHPSDTLGGGGGNRGNGGNGLDTVTGTVGGNQCPTAFECQMRSPDVNTAYYNPATLYLPWHDPLNPTLRLPAASFSNAYFDPKAQGNGAASTDLRSQASVLANWCTQAGNGGCASGSRPFNAAIFYLIKDDVVDPNRPDSYTKYDLNAISGDMPWSQFTRRARSDCSPNACTVEQERANFANWFTYHRSRILLTKGAVSEAFAALGDNFRLGWGTISNARSLNLVDGLATSGGPTQGVRVFSATHKTTFLNWLQNAPVNGSTPLRYATQGVGAYFSRTDNGSPWRSDPSGSTVNNPILGCRRAGHIMTTDGYYNDDGGPAGNFDNSLFAVGDADGKGVGRYTPTPPYADTNNVNSLADIAMKYWATPLVPSSFFNNAKDAVKPTPQDPATWLHLNQFMLSLGLKGVVDQDTVATTKTTPTSWTKIPKTADISKIDDMVHAAVNARGRYYSVNDGQTIKDAITQAIQSGLSTLKQEGGLASSGLSAVAGAQVYIPNYNPSGWVGDIKAYTLDANGNVVFNGTTPPTPTWQASQQLPAPASRNIQTYLDAKTGGVPFDDKTIKANSSLLQLLASGYQTGDYINYLRGDVSIKTTNASNGTGTSLRTRTSSLGDFINSTPTIVAGNLDMGYDISGLADGGSNYRDFVKAKAARASTLFVGANDGMLHGFEARTGKESFAYVPRGAFPTLHLLGDPAYTHQYYVDGPLTEADAYIGTRTGGATPAWTNVLIGTMGAGGKSVFALDVTGTARPNGSATLGSGQVMWEISGSDSTDLGSVTSRVQVGHVQGGAWYAFVGNGQESASGKAALLVIDLSTGAIVKTFVLPNASDAAGLALPNGLSGVNLIRDATGDVIGAYAGDLHGQVWRFEFSGNNPADPALWTVGFGGKPLFVARSVSGEVQKISAAPIAFKLPGSSGTVGSLIIFGTGRLSDTTDASDSSVQSIYAVLDETLGARSSGTSPLIGTNGGRALLQAQTFQQQLAGNGLIQLSSNSVSFTGTSKQYGWYIDLDLPSSVVPGATGTANQRPKVIYQPQLVRNLVFVSAVTAPDASTGCDSQSGSSYSFLLPALSGGQLAVPTFGSSGSNVVSSTDSKGQAFRTSLSDGDSLIRDTSVDRYKKLLDTQDARAFDSCAAGGCEMVISDRVWKRLVKPPF